MPVDLEKISSLATHPRYPAAAGVLRREGEVILLGGGLPLRPTLETVFDSDSQSPIPLFAFAFADGAGFEETEPLVRGVKKNFRGFLLGRFAHPPSPAQLERSYAAGLDLLELPLSPRLRPEDLHFLDDARSVFPRWGVIGALAIGTGGTRELAEAVDLLLERGIVPLLQLTPAVTGLSPGKVADLYAHLEDGWSRAGVPLKPLQPLLALTTPLAPPPPRRGLGALLEKAQEAQLRTSSDWRRLLRVRQVEESFESAGL